MIPWPGGIAYFSDDITDRLASIEREMENAAFCEASLALGGRGSGVISENGEIRAADEGFCVLTGAGQDQIKGASSSRCSSLHRARKSNRRSTGATAGAA